MKYKRHIPEGTQDMLFDKCMQKSTLERKLGRLFSSFGYAEIETPVLEYYDVFTQGKDSISTEAMYKLVDQKGRLLVLRPDMTVPVARVAGTKLAGEYTKRPVRICYSGRVFRFNEDGIGGQKDILQSGIELLGAKSPKADAEVIALAVNSLLEAGLDSFTIDIGQVEFFKGLMEAGGFTEGEIEAIRELIDRKDMSGVEQIIREHSIDDKLKETILSLPNYFGDADMLRKLEQSGLNERSQRALEYLDQVIELARIYGIDKYISVDLGMVQKLSYYTGIIFKGFASGVGFPVLSGGRYDCLVEKYGKPCAAVGFSVNLGMVMAAMEKQANEQLRFQTDFALGYADGLEGQAYRLANRLRMAGKRVEADLQGKSLTELMAISAGASVNVNVDVDANSVSAQVIYLMDENTVQVYCTSTGSTERKTIQNLLYDAMTELNALPPIH